MHELISCGQLAGVLRGVADKAVYIPDVYTRSQNKWVDSFLASNGYLGEAIRMPRMESSSSLWCFSCLVCKSRSLSIRPPEFSVLSRVGIDDPRGYARQRYDDKEGLVILESCCLGPAVLCEVEGALEEMKTTGSWVDVLVRCLSTFVKMSWHLSYFYAPFLLPFCLLSNVNVICVFFAYIRLAVTHLQISLWVLCFQSV